MHVRGTGNAVVCCVIAVGKVEEGRKGYLRLPREANGSLGSCWGVQGPALVCNFTLGLKSAPLSSRYRWSDGNEYDGEWKSGKMHGNGTFVWKSGERYDGEWSAGQESGIGVFTWTDGSVYDGFWEAGLKHGIGIFWRKWHRGESPGCAASRHWRSDLDCVPAFSSHSYTPEKADQEVGFQGQAPKRTATEPVGTSAGGVNGDVAAVAPKGVGDPVDQPIQAKPGLPVPPLKGQAFFDTLSVAFSRLVIFPIPGLFPIPPGPPNPTTTPLHRPSLAQSTSPSLLCCLLLFFLILFCRGPWFGIPQTVHPPSLHPYQALPHIILSIILCPRSASPVPYPFPSVLVLPSKAHGPNPSVPDPPPPRWFLA